MPWKALGLVVTVLAGLLAVGWGAVLLEDRQYPAFTYAGPPVDHAREAVWLVFSEDAPNTVWPGFETHILPRLRDLQSEGEVELVLSFAHDPLGHPTQGGAWTHAVLVMLAPHVDGTAAAARLLAHVRQGPLAAQLGAFERLRLQPGIDMFYPSKHGFEREAALVHKLEYVFSEPAARPGYYADQYTLSGPAMRDLHLRDKAGRFVGFEVKARLFSAPGMPAWDVVHIVGTTPWQGLKSVPVFLSTWAKHASRVHGPDSTFFTLLDRWATMRINVKTSATQNLELSLRPPHAP